MDFAYQSTADYISTHISGGNSLRSLDITIYFPNFMKKGQVKFPQKLYSNSKA